MHDSAQKHWERALALIRNNVSAQQFDTWFKPIVFRSFEEKTLDITIQVPSPFVYEYIEENFVGLLRKVLYRTFGEGVRLNYMVVTDKEHQIAQNITSDGADKVLKPVATHLANQSPTLFDIGNRQPLNPHLNPQSNFDTFIEGDSNKLPRSVALAIADHPQSTQFNPMFVYGPSGCGKTHLLNAIGLQTLKNFSTMRVLYVSARLFQVQYTNAVVKNCVNDFIAFYQTIDMLLVDDIQEWMTASRTQDTFFHIFNHMFRNGKRIVLASDRPPVDLKGMNERLLTRFACGLIAELERPNYELCVKILQNEIHRNGLHISADVVNFIASTARGSVRDLQGVVNSLLAYSVVYNCAIDIKLVKRVIERAVKIDNEPLTIDDIIDTVSKHYGISVTAINSTSRRRECVLARQVSMYLAQKYTHMPASRIGKLVGGRDHSTVIHSCSKVQRMLRSEHAFAKEIQLLEESFKLKN